MRSSSATTLLKEITQKKECPSCLVITSPDRIRRERSLRFILKHFCAEAGPSVRSFSFGEQGRNSPIAFVRDLAEPSLFESSRFGVVRGIESAKAADLEPLSDFIRKTVPGSHLIIVGESLPNAPTFKKVLDGHATLLSLEVLKGAELSRWIEREVAQSGISGADDEVLELLGSLGSEDPDTIAKLIEKFSLYLGDSQATTQALRALEPGRATVSDFELAETLLGKNRGTAEAFLLQLLAQGSSPFMMLGLLTKTFTTLYRIRTLMDKGVSNNEMKNSLGISPWLFSKYQPLAQRVSSRVLEDTIQALCVADFKLKDRSLGPAAIVSSVAQQTSARRN